jgi:hypothetical protein
VCRGGGGSVDGFNNHFLPSLPQTKEDVHDGPVFVMSKVHPLLLLLQRDMFVERGGC